MSFSKGLPPAMGVSHSRQPPSEAASDGTTILAPVDVDPRSWFSNERTCIEWLHSAGILGAFSAGLVTSNQWQARMAGISLTFPAVFVAVHAASMQRKRSKQLDARAVDAHFDQIGPTVLTFVLTLSLVFTLLVAVAHFYFAERLYRGDGFDDAVQVGVPAIFWLGGVGLAFGLAMAVTMPPHLGGTSATAAAGAPNGNGLAQPFLELEPRAVNHGPMRPKLLYANERTFIHWSHVCSLVASTAVAITTNPQALGAAGPLNTLVAGGLLTCTAIGLLGYAHATYFWRARAIMYRADRRVDDAVGPPALAAALMVAILGGLVALCIPGLHEHANADAEA